MRMIQLQRVLPEPLLWLLVWCCMSFIGLSGALWAEQVSFYTLPGRSQRVPGSTGPEGTPLRISLAGEWQVWDAWQKQLLGTVQQPFSYRAGLAFRFRRTFTLPQMEYTRFQLHLEGVQGGAQIWFNDQPVFQGARPFLPLEIPLPRHAVRPENTLEILLQPGDEHWQAFLPWLPINIPLIEAGLLGDIWIEVKPRLHLSDVHTQTSLQAEGWLLNWHCRVTGDSLPGRGVRLVLRVLQNDRVLAEQVQPVAPPSLPRELSGTLPLKEANPWTPENPALATLEIALWHKNRLIHEKRLPIALRHMALQGDRLLIQGEPYLLNGINYLYQHAEGTTLFDVALARRDLQEIKRRGFNALRVVFAPLPEAFYTLCDHLGLLCFQDLPLLQGLVREKDKTAYRVYQQNLLDYVSRLAGRHPSLVGVGLGYFADVQNPHFGELLRALDLAGLEHLILYLNSPIKPPAPVGAAQLILLELLQRNQPMRSQNWAAFTGGTPAWPTAFSRAISYRVDSTLIASDLLQLLALKKEADRLQKQGKLSAHFLPTFVDYRVNFPSLQNGLYQNFTLTQMGLFTIDRQPRQFPQLEAELITPSQNPWLISEARSRHSYLYILSSFLIGLIFLISYQQSPDFRHNLSYGLRKPHGFFVNLQERLYIPSGQTLLMLVAISGGLAVYLHSVMFYFRNNLLFDYLLSLLFFTWTSKVWISRLIWHQPLGLLVFFLVPISGVLILSAVLWLAGRLVKKPLKYREAIAIHVWCQSPLLFLLPLAIFLYNLLLRWNIYGLTLVILLFLAGWSYLRWINGIRVFLETLYGRVFLTVTVLLTALAVGGGFLLQQKVNLLAHLQFIYHIYQSMH